MNLKQLAESLGLSQTTVSRALNGYPEVADATRQRVQDAAQRYSYRPNARARSLATGRANAIGHVIPVSAQHEMVNPVFSDFIAGAGETYLLHGYDMIISVVPDADEKRVYREIAAKGTVDGFIVHGPTMDEPRIELLQQIGLPFVVHGRATQVRTPYDWVDVNNRSAFRRATKFLLDLGHVRIALVNGLAFMDFAKRRRDGYADALSAQGVNPDPALIRCDEMTEGFGYGTSQELLALEDPPTAFLASSIITAFGIRRAVEEAGLRVAHDISIVTHDDELSYMRNGTTVPLFTATRSSVREAGRLCAERLIARINNPGQALRGLLLEAELAIGLSTGPALQNAKCKTA